LEIPVLLGVCVLAAWLRLRDLDLMEFKEDEAIAVDLARRILDGDVVTTGLESSIGAHNPPLFAYLIAIPVAVGDDPRVTTAFVGVLAAIAVALTYFVLRPRLGAFVALAASALFATAPWAVLYGRKLWGQSVLPIVCVGLLWSLFVVLERPRSRAAACVPILLCVAFQLGFSALALVVPACVVMLYRAREVHWRAAGAGTCVALLLLAPWLSHQVTTGFEDVAALAGGDEEMPAPEPGAMKAARQSIRLLGTGGWDYVAADSMPAFVEDVGRTWRLSRAASTLASFLFVLGLATCALCVVRGASTSRRWPWLVLGPVSGTRALLLVWLTGVWLTYATPTSDRLFPHYLVVTYPVAFAVQALALADLVCAFSRGLRRIAAISAVAVVVVIAVGFTAFTISFQRFVDRNGGTAGDYGVVYRDKASLARIVRARGLRVDDEPVIDFLVVGRGDVPLGDPPYVSVTDRLHNVPPPCAGVLRSFGVLSACLPPR
jgi:hypothetical protein